MQDALLRFAIPVAVATSVRVGALAASARGAGVPDVRFRFSYTTDDCDVECSRDMAVVLATAILMCASRDDCPPAACAGAERAVSVILALLGDSPLPLATDSDQDRLCC
ncbi:MAG TPA: hypothetical protein VGM50_22620 [Gemmatimonadaceae bacterium]|jgi:hypothetical protein